MAYLGTGVEHSADDTLAKDKDIINRTLNTMTGDNSDTTLTLSMTPASVNNVDVYLDGVRQRPTTDYTVSGTTLTFTTAPPTGVVVIALTGSAEPIGITTESFPRSDFETITDAKIASGIASSKLTGALPALNGSNLTSLPAGNLTGTVADARISTLTASKLSGALPAISGANLTGINLTPAYTKSASDPVITTNPSGGVGTVWSNSTTGEVYVCTDATSNENVWTNVGSGSGDVLPWSFPGTSHGYVAGGQPATTTIEKYAFASNTTAASHGDLIGVDGGTYWAANHNGETHGFEAGGIWDSSYTDRIEKIAFASNTNAADHGDMSVGRASPIASSTSTHGYTATGRLGSGANTTVVDKYSFASNTTAASHGSFRDAVKHYGWSSHSSATHGFGTGSDAQDTRIEKFSFASAAESTDHADLLNGRKAPIGCSSSTDGFVCGGNESPTSNDIQKFSFSSGSTATDHGDLTYANHESWGASSTTDGFTAGARASYSTNNYVQKFTYSSGGASADHGDLQQSKHRGGNGFHQ